MVKPGWLGPIASEVWDAAMETLRGRNCVSPAYVDFLAMYCEAHEELHAAMKEIERDGMFCMSEKGAMYQHPAVGVKHKAMEFIGRFGREFGFSPTSVRDIQQTEKPDATESKKRKYAGA